MYRPENYIRKGFRMCSNCTAEKPNTEEFFAPEYAGKCRRCVARKDPPCPWGTKALHQPKHTSHKEWAKENRREQAKKSWEKKRLRTKSCTKCDGVGWKIVWGVKVRCRTCRIRLGP